MPNKQSKNTELADLRAQVDELTAALQRERADALNAARRHDEQLASVREHAKVAVVHELLPVIDNFERALKHTPSELKINDFVKGVEVIVKQFEKTLADLGVSRIETVGKVFNPELHEAVSVEEGKGDKEIVSEELQSGYKLGDKVVRHAMVRVRMQ